MKVRYLLVLAVIMLLAGCGGDRKPYGVFLSTSDDLSRFKDYDMIVIDAQYYDREAIEQFRQEGHKVYSYINVGSLEDFRDYYDAYEGLTLGDYEHWDEEKWIDVSSEKWQNFVIDELALSLAEKCIDGFFVDNCDVYYQYPTEEILEGLAVIMKGLKTYGIEVIVNGGDAFMDAYTAEGGAWDDVISGINQESVFSRINWEDGSFGPADSEDRDYFIDYIERYGGMGADIYLLEYTSDPKLVKTIDEYCKSHRFTYYVSDSLELK